ncbi:MAG: transketolase [Clostridiales bacterium]|nr:transketolase [Clostridiales bacterium]
MKYELNELKTKVWDLRKDTLDIIMAGGGGHIGGDMSVIDALSVLYFRQMNVSPETADDPDRDYYVMSKGHSVEAYYAVLCAAGFLNLDEVKAGFSKFGSEYIGHPNNHLKGIEMNTGSLGHGLPVSVGIALAAKMDGRPSRVYTVMGDGELAEGSVWEGFMSGHMYKLDNLCAIIDRNHLQISGNTEDVMAQEVLTDKVKAFGWHVVFVQNGNDVSKLDAAFEEARNTKGQPTCIISNTVKGCGSSVMENKAPWHHKVPTTEEYDQMISDFAERKEAAANE